MASSHPLAVPCQWLGDLPTSLSRSFIFHPQRDVVLYPRRDTKSYPHGQGMDKMHRCSTPNRLEGPSTPPAIPLATRQEIVRRHLDGQPLARIAADLHLPHGSARAIRRAFRRSGEAGLATGYHRCGLSTPRSTRAVLERACRLNRKHPTWGAGRIRVELLAALGPSLVPSARTLQRAFQREQGRKGDITNNGRKMRGKGGGVANIR